MARIELDVLNDTPVPLDVGEQTSVEWGSREYVPIVTTELPDWTGPYEATPTQETQVFDMNGYAMRGSFTVNPIPSNYGLVTWNGVVLSVS